MRLIRSSFLLTILLSAGAASAQSIPALHPAANLSATGGQTSDLPQLAADGATVFAVWREQVPALNRHEIRLRRSGNHGAAFADGPSGRLLATIPVASTIFSLRVAAAGSNVVVVFASGPSELDAEVTLIRSGDGGLTFGAPVSIGGPGSAYADVAVTGAGEAHLVMDDRADGEIKYRQSLDGGATFSAPVNISGSAEQSIRPRVGAAGSVVAAVWQETGLDGTSPADVAFALSDDGGGSFAAAVNLSASGAASLSPAVAVLNSIHVAWTENGQIVRRQSADGVSFSGVVAIGVPAAGEVAGGPSIAGAGSIVNVAWTTTDGSGAIHGPFLRRSLNDGASFSTALDLQSGLGGLPLDGVAVGGGSPLKIFWSHAASGFVIDAEMLFRREIACGTSWASPVSGSWTDATKWTGGVVPGASDDVCIQAAGSYTVTLQGAQSANTVTLGSEGSGGPTLRIDGNRPTSTGTIFNASLTVANGFTNFGTLILSDSGFPTAAASLIVSSGGLTNAAGATFQTLDATNNGGRTLNADLTNDGTVLLDNGASFTKSGGIYTNNGAFSIGAGETLAMTGGGTFVQRGGTLAVDGAFTITGGTFNYGGGSLSGSAVEMSASALHIGDGSTGAGTFRMYDASTLSGNVAAAQTVIVEGRRPTSTGTIFNATLTAAESLINAGTIRLTSSGFAAPAATLAIGAGAVLTNASGGTIETVAGVGGARTLTGSITNAGTVNASVDTTLTAGSSTFTSTGSVLIAASRTLSVTGTVTQDGGLLDVDGTFVLTGGTFNFNGGTVDGTALLVDSALNIGPGSTGMATFRTRNASTLSGDIAAAQTVIIDGYRPTSTGTIFPATLTASAHFTNAGTITLTSSGFPSAGATLAVKGGTLTNTGLIETVAGQDGARTIAGNLTNLGVIEIENDTSLTGAGATRSNAGAVSILASQTLQIDNGNGSFSQDGGTLSIAGGYLQTGGTFGLNGGVITGSPELWSLHLQIGPGSSATGTVRSRGASTMSGNIMAGQTVVIEGYRPTSTGTQFHATLTASADFTSAGTIRLTSAGFPSANATLVMAAGSTLTSTGLIETLVAQDGGRTITGNFANSGTVEIEHHTAIDGAGAVRTNTGTFTVFPNKNLTMAGGSFHQNGGTLDIQGRFIQNGGTFQSNGGSINGATELNGSVLAMGTGSVGIIRMRGTATLTGSITAGQTVVIEGHRDTSTGTIIHAVLTANGSFSNAGILRFTSTGFPSSGATLVITSGTMTSTGTIEFLQGQGGARTITGSVTNNGGSVTVDADTTFNGSGATFTNDGAFSVLASRTLTVSGGASFQQDGGPLTVTGAFDQAGGAFGLDGGAISGAPVLTGVALGIEAGSTATGTVKVRNASTLSGSIKAGQQVIIEGYRPTSTGTIFHATLTSAAGFTNAGTITLTSAGFPSASATLAITSGSLISAGLMESVAGQGGGRVVTGSFVNTGTVEIEHSTDFNGVGATHANSGSFLVVAGKTLSIANGGSFHQNSGPLDIAGTFAQSGGGFSLNGGVIVAPGSPILTGVALTVGPGSTATGTVRVRNASTITGNIAAGQTVIIEGYRPTSTGTIFHATLTAASSFTSAGTIVLTSVGFPSAAATLAIASGTLTNAGLIETLAGQDGARTITGNVVNNGTVEIENDTTFDGTAATTRTNNGSFSVLPGQTLTLTAGSFHQSGGPLDIDGTFAQTGGTFGLNGGVIVAPGAPILTGVALSIGPGSSATGTVRMRTSSTVSGNIATGQIVIVEGHRPTSTGTIFPAVLTASGNVINDGTIRLTSSGNPAAGATLAVPGGTLTNNGLIETVAGVGGARSLTGGITNNGTVDLDVATDFNSGTFRNVSPGSVTGGSTFTLLGSSIVFATGNITANVINQGQFNPGQSPGAATITGNYTQTSTGAFNAEIGGLAPGTGYDQLNVSGTVALAGRLNISMSGGFCGTGTFDILTYGAKTAPDFATKTGLIQGGLTFTTSTPNPNTYRLTATGTCPAQLPSAVADSYSVDEDEVLAVSAPGVLANDTDPEGHPLTAVISANATHGVVALAADGSFTYTPTPGANFSGVDTFTYTARDGAESSNVATVTISVNPVNDAPSAFDDAYETAEDTALLVASAQGVLQNDDDVDGPSATVAVLVSPQFGDLTLNPDGSFTYMPDPEFSGSDSFQYQVDDGAGGSDTGSVALAVTAVNDAPIASNAVVSTDEDTAAGLTLVATDVESPVLTYVIVDAPQHGTLTQAGAAITYTPDVNYHGPDAFTFQASDGSAASDVATVSIAVNPVNDAPVASNDSYSVDEDGTLLVAVGDGLLQNDDDVDGPALSAILLAGPSHGTLTLDADGSFTYTPEADYNGGDGFTYTVSDGTLSAVGTVAITVAAVNDAPVAQSADVSTNEDTAVVIPLAGSDVDSATFEYIIVTAPLHGTLSTAGPTVTYTPDSDYHGGDVFTFTIRDGESDSNVASVSVTIESVNDAPVAGDDGFSVAEDGTLIIGAAAGVLANDTDVDGPAAEALLLDAPDHGTVTLAGDGSFTYQPDENYSGSDSLSYQVVDGAGGLDIATVVLTVTPVNDAPVIGGVTDLSGTVGSPVGLTVTGTDVEDAALAFEATGLPAGASFNTSTGVFSWTPAVAGSFSVVFTVRDSGGLTASRTSTMTIASAGSNTAPICTAARPSVDTIWPPNGRMVGVNVLGVTDADGDVVTIVITAVSANEPIAAGDIGGVGSATAQLRARRPGAARDGLVYTVSFTATDPDGASCSGQVTVTVPHDQRGR